MLSKSLKDHHDGVFVVTVESFAERRANAVRELGEGNFEFIFSVDKAAVTKEQLIADGTYDEARAVEIDRRGKAMTLGHICCSLGHIRAYRGMLDNAIGRALIFEDDVVALPVAEASIEAAVRSIPRDADLIYWGWSGIEKRPIHGAAKQILYKAQHSLGFLKYNHTMIENLYPKEYNDHFRVAGKQFCSHAYTLTARGAEKLLEWNTPVALNADNALMYASMNGDIKAYISKQQFFGQRSLIDSDPIPSLTQT